jgi:ATP-dependent Lon protease
MSDTNSPVIEDVNGAVTEMPLLPLRDVVVYPHMVIPLFVGRERSIQALETATKGNKRILLATQKEATLDDPSKDDIYTVGTISSILQLLKLPDGTVKVLVEGIQRGRVLNYVHTEPYFSVTVDQIKGEQLGVQEIEVLMRSLISQFEQYIKLNKKIPPEILSSLAGIDEPVRLVDTIAAHMSLKIPEKQKVLEISSLTERIEHLMAIMESEIDLLQVEKRIRGNVKRQMEKSQREYYLNEQMKAIQKELGEMGEDGANEIDDLRKKIEKAGMTKEASTKALAELNKLKMMSPMSAEASVCRNYIDWMVSVPWKKHSKTSINLPQAEEVLNKEHYGLEKVKERILEYLAVQQRMKKIKGPVLCLVGPPGVGKTSLGQSIAHATQRKFVRMALGGVRDEAEIRGHRKTYIGAMPGKIIQKLSKVEVKNPLFLLDEIDKIATDYRGDPASALLEVLDPEQNHTFNDHYLEVDYDLSDIMFIATANSLNIPAPLLDRMEVIRIAGYIEDEKLNIATNYLVPKQLEANGLKPEELTVSKESIIEIIRYYTREAGVRSLEREISKLCRKIVKQILMKPEDKSFEIKPEDLEKYLGVRKYRYGEMEEHDQVGQVTGLAWTEVGGEILTIEAAIMSGKGKVARTGKLGDVMQESIEAAMTVVRSRARSLGIAADFFEKHDVHIHVPEGATPKDGPSAGIGMCTAMVSAFTGIAVRCDVAMTGEITLRGQVLPIGGLKEKLLAAKRAGIKNVIIPSENVRDLKEIGENIYDGIDIHPVKWIDEVLDLALVSRPVPLTDEEVAAAEAAKAKAPKNDNAASDDQEIRAH